MFVYQFPSSFFHSLTLFQYRFSLYSVLFPFMDEKTCHFNIPHKQSWHLIMQLNPKKREKVKENLKLFFERNNNSIFLFMPLSSAQWQAVLDEEKPVLVWWRKFDHFFCWRKFGLNNFRLGNFPVLFWSLDVWINPSKFPANEGYKTLFHDFEAKKQQ